MKCTEGLADYNPQIPFTVEKSTPHLLVLCQLLPEVADHAYFAMHSVPTLVFSNTDPFGYNFSYREIWHTTRDLYNLSISEYMEYTSVTQVVTIYNIANLKNLLPRDGIYIQE